MRAFIFIALVAAAMSADLCKKKDNKKINAIRATVRVGASTFIGASCPALSDSIDDVLFKGKCQLLAKQAMCYGFRAEEHYAGSEVVSYGQLAGDIDNIAALGKLTCVKAAGCFNQIAKAVKKCVKSNPDFVRDTIAAAEAAYKLSAQADVEAFVASKSDTLFGELANMAMGEFNSASDIENFVNEYVSGNLKAQVASDASAAIAEAKELAIQWCAGDCTDESAAFVKSLFNGMHGGQCLDASQFCGSCKDNAHAFLDGGNSIPCCLDEVIQKGIQAYDYVAEAYGEKINEWAGQVSDQLSEAANSRAAEIRDEIVLQAGCIASAYGDHKPVCA